MAERFPLLFPVVLLLLRASVSPVVQLLPIPHLLSASSAVLCSFSCSRVFVPFVIIFCLLCASVSLVVHLLPTPHSPFRVQPPRPTFVTHMYPICVANGTHFGTLPAPHKLTLPRKKQQNLLLQVTHPPIFSLAPLRLPSSIQHRASSYPLDPRPSLNCLRSLCCLMFFFVISCFRSFRNYSVLSPFQCT